MSSLSRISFKSNRARDGQGRMIVVSKPPKSSAAEGIGAILNGNKVLSVCIVFVCDWIRQLVIFFVKRDVYLTFFKRLGFDKMGLFYTIKPYCQLFLKEGSVEYHIYFDNDKAGYDFTNAYERNNPDGEEFMEDVYEYMWDLFENKLIEHGTDTNRNEDDYCGNEKYIWIHLNKSSQEKDLKDILAALEKEYHENWCLQIQRVNSLLKIVKGQLGQKKVLAYAVSDFQRRKGVMETQNVLHVLFDQILK